MHLLAHPPWAQAAMIAGGVQLAVVRGKLVSQYWSLVTAGALALAGASFLIPVGAALRPRRMVWTAGFALTFVLIAVLLFSDRDFASVFGHFGQLEGATRP